MTSVSPLGVCITAGDAWKTLPTPCPQKRGTTPTLHSHGNGICHIGQVATVMHL